MLMSYAVESGTATDVMPPIVLIVHDDVSARESLASLMALAGWQTRTFASAKEFLAHPTQSRGHVA